MFRMMGNKRLLLFLASIVFFIALMGFTLNVRASVLWPEQFVADSVGLGQQSIYQPVRYVAQLLDDIRRLKVIYEENEALRITLSQYARDRARLNELEDQNQRLKEALSFTERQKQVNEIRYRVAEVISESTDRYNRVLKINIGSRDGIRTDMAVMTVDGLIGRVVRTYPFTANVQLITDLNGAEGNVRVVAAAVQGRESESFGIIESYDPQQGTLLMTKIDQNDPLQPSDIVVTSGLGELFPAGIVIGTVMERQVGDFGLTHTAIIQPAAQFTQLHEVFVVEVPEIE
jgi:rod shape-determining protein MreC